jgi:hypothetical protein
VSLLQEQQPSLRKPDAAPATTPVGEATAAERELSWEKILHLSLAASPEEIAIQRSWGTLAARLRDLAPETEWLFLREETPHPNEAVLVARLQRWLEALVTGPAWPAPVRVIVTAEGSARERSWKVAADKAIGSLPYTPPPASLNVTPWKDQHLVGWKIRPIYSFTVNKAGEA